MFASFFGQKSLAKYLGLTGILASLVCLNLHLGIGVQFLGFFEMSPLAKMMTVLTLVILFFIFLVSGNYEKEYDWSATLSLMLFSTCGAILLYGYSNLLTLFLGIEILSIPLYVMAASKRKHQNSLEAGLKYFILGSFSSAFLLFGIALIYGTFGSFHIDRIVEIQKMTSINLPPYFHIGVLLIIISLLFKMAIAPFHFWSPDVYDGSPTIVTAYMSTIVKISATMAMYYILAGFFTFQINIWAQYIIAVICISLLIGSIMGLVQKNVKRIMAYSSITHAAFILSSLVLAIVFQNPGVITFYLIAYTIASLAAFLILDNIKSGNEIHLDHLNGYAKQNPILAVTLAVAVLSMAGIPLTGGFIAKFNILSGLYLFNKWMFVLALLSSGISIAFYLKIINRMFFYENSIENVAVRNFPLIITSIILGVIILILGIVPTLIPLGIQQFFF